MDDAFVAAVRHSISEDRLASPRSPDYIIYVNVKVREPAQLTQPLVETIAGSQRPECFRPAQSGPTAAPQTGKAK
jgi:hypothetical protein